MTEPYKRLKYNNTTSDCEEEYDRHHNDGLLEESR